MCEFATSKQNKNVFMDFVSMCHRNTDFMCHNFKCDVSCILSLEILPLSEGIYKRSSLLQYQYTEFDQHCINTDAALKRIKHKLNCCKKNNV